MLFALLVACSTDPAAEPALPVIQSKAADPVIAEHMEEHFHDATIALEAWLSGEIETSRKHLNWLADHQAPDSLIPGTEKDLEAMQLAAKQAAKGGPPDKVAQQIAAVGTACGACHLHSGVKPKLQVPPIPKASKELSAHMTGHLWAVQTLWSGMVTHERDFWDAGVAHLGADPLHEEALGKSPELLALAAEVHRHGADAKTADTPQAREKVFAALIATCVRCHVETRGE